MSGSASSAAGRKLFINIVRRKFCAFYAKSNLDVAVLRNSVVQEIKNLVLQEMFMFGFYCQEEKHLIYPGVANHWCCPNVKSTNYNNSVIIPLISPYICP